ncbi:branched-chain-amino-acid transaminase [Paenibacillus sp. KACC 21273]|uniref:branched-chain-amino-acid transaminase n=1 Tax=Paenibacillus sp. KACC 21273 TaxID=3025665 RepID=UPI00236706C1|nr:branched-chain-amino-acid transaminase [Paenibacillus sp. KACC 21273]WDF52836.1 branched-chain-amino-acid transaminase [Paenibacillus sp. KACC 21273]
MNEQIIFIDGNYVKKSEALISVYDRGLLFGDGVFEGIRAYNGNVFLLEEHIKRLFNSAKSLMIDIPYNFDECINIILQTLLKNKLHTAYIRIILSRGVGDGYNLSPFLCPKPSFMVMAESFEAFPKEYYKSGIEAVTVPTRRTKNDSLSPQIKSLNYLNNIQAKTEALIAGAQDGIILNDEGYVVEATTQNIFIVKEDRLLTPYCSLGALEGITRNFVMRLASNKGIKVEEHLITRHDLYIADEVFMTGTAAEMIAVVKIDGRVIGQGEPGLLTVKLYENFLENVEKEGVFFL